MNEQPWIADDAQVDDVRARIVAAAIQLIASGGRDAATTRAVAAGAHVQAPTIYRLFGDKRGLLDAVAQHGLADYVSKKSARLPNADPVQELTDRGHACTDQFGESDVCCRVAKYSGQFSVGLSDEVRDEL